MTRYKERKKNPKRDGECEAKAQRERETRDADRNPEGKRDSMSVHADGDRSVWSHRAAES